MLFSYTIDAQTTVTFTAKSDKGTVTANGTGNSDELTKDGISLSVSDGVLGNGSNYRIYGNATFTISSTVGNITKVVFTTTSTSNTPSNLSVTNGSYSYSSSNKTGTWTGDAESVEFTASAQVKATQIEVTYTAASSTTCATPTIFPASHLTSSMRHPNKNLGQVGIEQRLDGELLVG